MLGLFFIKNYEIQYVFVLMFLLCFVVFVVLCVCCFLFFKKKSFFEGMGIFFRTFLVSPLILALFVHEHILLSLARQCGCLK